MSKTLYTNWWPCQNKQGGITLNNAEGNILTYLDESEDMEEENKQYIITNAEGNSLKNKE